METCVCVVVLQNNSTFLFRRLSEYEEEEEEQTSTSTPSSCSSLRVCRENDSHPVSQSLCPHLYSLHVNEKCVVCVAPFTVVVLILQELTFFSFFLLSVTGNIAVRKCWVYSFFPSSFFS